MEVIWNPDKNAALRRDRGIGFEEIAAAIEAGGLVANQPHPNRDRYPHQRVLIVAIHDYAYVVPCVVTGGGMNSSPCFRVGKPPGIIYGGRPHDPTI